MQTVTESIRPRPAGSADGRWRPKSHQPMKPCEGRWFELSGRQSTEAFAGISLEAGSFYLFLSYAWMLVPSGVKRGGSSVSPTRPRHDRPCAPVIRSVLRDGFSTQFFSCC